MKVVVILCDFFSSARRWFRSGSGGGGVPGGRSQSRKLKIAGELAYRRCPFFFGGAILGCGGIRGAGVGKGSGAGKANVCEGFIGGFKSAEGFGAGGVIIRGGSMAGSLAKGSESRKGLGEGGGKWHVGAVAGLKLVVVRSEFVRTTQLDDVAGFSAFSTTASGSSGTIGTVSVRNLCQMGARTLSVSSSGGGLAFVGLGGRDERRTGEKRKSGRT